MSVGDMLIAMGDIADQVAAAADLDDDARQDVDVDLQVGNVDQAIFNALLTTRTPLPADLLNKIRVGVRSGWYQGDIRQQVLAALDSQQATGSSR